jgi:hypothetical protein
VTRKTRAYSPRALKSNYSYTLEQIVDLYGMSIATVRRWIRIDGLKRVPGVRPFLVHSSDLKAFLEQRNNARRHPCAQHEVYCFRCRLPRTPQIHTGAVETLPNATTRFQAKCSICGGKIFKAIGRLNWSEKHPLAAYLQDAPEQHNGVHSQPPECSLGEGQ